MVALYCDRIFIFGGKTENKTTIFTSNIAERENPLGATLSKFEYGEIYKDNLIPLDFT